MRVIVFDRELHEPITVVEVPHKFAEQAKKGMRIAMIPVTPPSDWPLVTQNLEGLSHDVCVRAVYLTFEPVRRGNDIMFWFAYADDPELALLLRAAFLPGQVGELQRQKAKAAWDRLWGSL